MLVDTFGETGDATDTHGGRIARAGAPGQLVGGGDRGVAVSARRAPLRVSEQDELDADLVFASVAKLGRPGNLARLAAQRFDYVVIDEAFYRPAEVDLLIGTPAKAEAKLGWKPEVGFEDLVTMMVDADLALLEGRLSGLH